MRAGRPRFDLRPGAAGSTVFLSLLRYIDSVLSKAERFFGLTPFLIPPAGARPPPGALAFPRRSVVHTHTVMRPIKRNQRKRPIQALRSPETARFKPALPFLVVSCWCSDGRPRVSTPGQAPCSFTRGMTGRRASGGGQFGLEALHKIAKAHGVGVSTVQRLKAELTAA